MHTYSVCVRRIHVFSLFLPASHRSRLKDAWITRSLIRLFTSFDPDPSDLTRESIIDCYRNNIDDADLYPVFVSRFAKHESINKQTGKRQTTSNLLYEYAQVVWRTKTNSELCRDSKSFSWPVFSRLTFKIVFVVKWQTPLFRKYIYRKYIWENYMYK